MQGLPAERVKAVKVRLSGRLGFPSAAWVVRPVRMGLPPLAGRFDPDWWFNLWYPVDHPDFPAGAVDGVVVVPAEQDPVVDATLM